MSTVKYLCDPNVIPAIVPRSAADISLYTETFAGVAEWLHLDFSDGLFTKDSNWPLRDLQIPREPTLRYEAHLMVVQPLDIGLDLLKRGVTRLVLHREAALDDDRLREMLLRWRSAGAVEVGVALQIDTPLNTIDSVVDAVDFVQLMSIARIGHQGEEFDDRTLMRVEELHANYPELMVSVDGGISEATVEELVRAGANRLVIGHALAESVEPAAVFARIHERAMRGCAPVNLEIAI